MVKKTTQPNDGKGKNCSDYQCQQIVCLYVSVRNSNNPERFQTGAEFANKLPHTVVRTVSCRYLSF